MEDFILNYTEDEKSIIGYDNNIYHSDVKPSLSFLYDSLYCETPTNIYFYVLNDIQHELSSKQIDECYAYAKDFHANGDYKVYAYDPNENYNYQGYMLKSVASSLSYRWTEIQPESDASFWNKNAKKWEQYYAALDEFGYMRIEIDRLCKSCVMFFTKEQYDKFPKPKHDVDTWDFISEKWVDKRNIDDLKYQYTRDIRDLFEQVRWYALDEYVPPYEQDTWRIQLDEAKAYLADETVETPYMDTFLNVRTDADKPTKKELARDIVENSKQYTIKVAEITGYQWNFLKKLQSCTTGYACDDVFSDVLKYCENHKKVISA